MDWTKAKSILIVALIITNLILIFANVYKGQMPGLNTNDSNFNDTLKLLESKNIFIETTLPERSGSMPVLTVEYDRIDEKVVEEQLEKQEVIPMNNLTDEKIIQITTDFIDKCGYLTENVQFSKLEKKEGKTTVTYKNYINEMTIEDSYIVFVIQNGRIMDFQRYWLSPVEFSKTKKNVIPPEAALIKLMSEKDLDEKMYIEDISLIYWLDSQSFDAHSPVSDTAFPTWKITYNNGHTRYIIAFEQ